MRTCWRSALSCWALGLIAAGCTTPPQQAVRPSPAMPWSPPELIQGPKPPAPLAGPAAGPNAPGLTYPERIKRTILPHIAYADGIVGNPEAQVEVTTESDGTVSRVRLLATSGVEGWDEAVQRAVLRAERLPRDATGRVPRVLVISFRPRGER